VRFQRLRGHEVASFSGDDTHGTATMIRAQQEGREPEALLEEVRRAHERDLADFGIRYDYYGSTHSSTAPREPGVGRAACGRARRDRR
jgi:methionyl-tRNA synthetase